MRSVCIEGCVARRSSAVQQLHDGWRDLCRVRQGLPRGLPVPRQDAALGGVLADVRRRVAGDEELRPEGVVLRYFPGGFVFDLLAHVPQDRLRTRAIAMTTKMIMLGRGLPLCFPATSAVKVTSFCTTRHDRARERDNVARYLFYLDRATYFILI